MPIYEYRCEDCGHTLDALQKISDAPLSECPACQQATLKRLISAPSFRLKGGGWYETDFKSDKERKRNLAESGDGKSADNKKESGEKAKESPKTEKKAGDSSSETKKPAAKKSTGSGSEAA